MNSSTLLELPKSAPKAELRVRKVLLAEDDGEMRRLLAGALRAEGYDVVEASDGEELLDRLSDAIVSADPVDCIVTDVRMPRFSGIQALGVIKTASLPMPVVVITAFGDHATHVDAWLMGAAAVMDKPFEIEDLLRTIRKIQKGP